MELIDMYSPLLLGGPYDGQRRKWDEKAQLQLSHREGEQPKTAHYAYINGVYLFLGYTDGPIR